MNPWGSVCRVYDRYGTPHVRTLGSTDPEQADELKAFAKWLRTKRKWDVLDLIIARRVTLAEAYDAHEAGTLAELAAHLHDQAGDIDIEPFVRDWARRANPRYVRQVRRLLPEAKPYPRSRFTRGEISRFLADLPDERASRINKEEVVKLASGSTQNRYYAALASFGDFLVEREILEVNPVYAVARAKENPARDISYTPEQAKQLIGLLEGEQRAMEALMAITGIEWGAVASLTREDCHLDVRKFRALGTKNKYRKRTVYAVIGAAEWEWAWEIVRTWVESVPLGHVFPNHQTNTQERRAIDAHQAACETLRLPVTTLHDWRHTYAVNAKKRRERAEYAKQNLGHAPNSTQLERVYGVWTPDEEERDAFARNLASKLEKQVEVDRAN